MSVLFGVKGAKRPLQAGTGSEERGPFAYACLFLKTYKESSFLKEITQGDNWRNNIKNHDVTIGILYTSDIIKVYKMVL